jgi:mannose-1-phosphate guanylyltransferase / mannose-6-phosphate isomerase
VPGVVDAATCALDAAKRDRNFLQLAPLPMTDCPSVSLDHAVMERSERLVAVPLEAGWRDLGSWSALWEMGHKDNAGNVLVGETIADEAHGCYLHSDGPLIAVHGVDDLIISATRDAVLVMRRGGDQAVRRIALMRPEAHARTMATGTAGPARTLSGGGVPER